MNKKMAFLLICVHLLISIPASSMMREGTSNSSQENVFLPPRVECAFLGASLLRSLIPFDFIRMIDEPAHFVMELVDQLDFIWPDTQSSFGIFQGNLLSAGDRLLAANTLVWLGRDWVGNVVISESDYTEWLRNAEKEWNSIRKGICWELFGILFLHSGYSSDRDLHNSFVNWFESESDNVEKIELDQNTANFDAGDIIMINGMKGHTVVATGNRDEVFSLWTIPHNGLTRISLRELLEMYLQLTDLRSIQIMHAKDVFEKLEFSRKSSDQAHSRF